MGRERQRPVAGLQPTTPPEGTGPIPVEQIPRKAGVDRSEFDQFARGGLDAVQEYPGDPSVMAAPEVAAYNPRGPQSQNQQPQVPAPPRQPGRPFSSPALDALPQLEELASRLKLEAGGNPRVGGGLQIKPVTCRADADPLHIAAYQFLVDAVASSAMTINNPMLFSRYQTLLTSLRSAIAAPQEEQAQAQPKTVEDKE